MPAKKTFYSIRVRGLVKLDSSLQLKGVPMVPYWELVALLQPNIIGHTEDEDLYGDPEVMILSNTFPFAINFTRFVGGIYRANAPIGSFPEHKTWLTAIAGMDDLPSVSGAWMSDQVVTFAVTFGNAPVENWNNLYVQIRVYK